MHFENITIENQFGKGLLKGQANATPGGDTYYTKNVNFTNLTIGGTKVHEGNKSLFFNIEESYYGFHC